MYGSIDRSVLPGSLGFVLSLVPGLVCDNGQSLFGRSEGRDVEVPYCILFVEVGWSLLLIVVCSPGSLFIVLARYISPS